MTKGGISWCFLRPIYFCLDGVEGILGNSNFYQRDHPASRSQHLVGGTTASSDELFVCTKLVTYLFRNETTAARPGPPLTASEYFLNNRSV